MEMAYGRDNETLCLFFHDFVRIMLTIGQTKFINIIIH